VGVTGVDASTCSKIIIRWLEYIIEEIVATGMKASMATRGQAPGDMRPRLYGIEGWVSSKPPLDGPSGRPTGGSPGGHIRW